ncbi:MAG: hypothetical protein IPK14_11110 [Blastocatellia bacterium]|nr:hypothetical protein [Blastocatellia bacterium]
MIKLREKAILTFIITVFVLLFLFSTITLSPTARLVPLAILIPTLLILIFQLILDFSPKLSEYYKKYDRVDLFNVKRRKYTDKEILNHLYKEEIKIFSYLLLLIISIYLLGVLITLPSYIFLYLRFGVQEKTKIATIISVAIFSLLYFVFIWLLKINFYSGLFWQ